MISVTEALDEKMRRVEWIIEGKFIRYVRVHRVQYSGGDKKRRGWQSA